MLVLGHCRTKRKIPRPLRAAPGAPTSVKAYETETENRTYVHVQTRTVRKPLGRRAQPGLRTTANTLSDSFACCPSNTGRARTSFRPPESAERGPAPATYSLRGFHACGPRLWVAAEHHPVDDQKSSSCASNGRAAPSTHAQRHVADRVPQWARFSQNNRPSLCSATWVPRPCLTGSFQDHATRAGFRRRLAASRQDTVTPVIGGCRRVHRMAVGSLTSPRLQV